MVYFILIALIGLTIYLYKKNYQKDNCLKNNCKDCKGCDKW